MRPSHAPTETLLAERGGIRILEVRCRAGRHDPSFDEEHLRTCICLVTRGYFSYRSADESRILAPGWLLLGNTGQRYLCSHEHAEGEGDDCLVLELGDDTVELIRSATNHSAASNPAFTLPCLPPLPRVAASMQLLLEAARIAGESLRLQECAFDVASTVLHELAEPGASRRPAAPPHRRRTDQERLHQAVAFIEDRAGDPLSLDEIAAAVDLSPFHFLRLFHHELGITPHQYLIRARLRRAVGLLRDTSLSITEIAYEAGYGDLSNFVRTFHKEVGCSPRTYRRAGPPRLDHRR